LRVPFIACFAVIMAVWLRSGGELVRAGATDSGGSPPRSSIDGREVE